jgi:NitT/TauT family transport system permease protein
MKFKNPALSYAIISFTALLLLWEMTARFSGWSEQVFPGPVVVMISLFELTINGTLLKHSVASLFRVTAGFYLAMFLGIPLGMLLGRHTPMRLLFNPVIHFLRPISPLAWIPLSMLWFGIGDMPAVFLIFLSSFFPILVATTIAVRSINPIYFQVAANFNFNNYESFSKIIVPATIPSIVTALRLSITIAWLVVVAAEMIAVQSGLGYLILDSRNALRMDYVMVGMVVIGAIGLLLDYIMRQMMKIESTNWAK